jgi:hypothetical protein
VRELAVSWQHSAVTPAPAKPRPVQARPKASEPPASSPAGGVADGGQHAGHDGRKHGLGHGRREQRVPADDGAREELRASGLLLQPGVPADQDAAQHGHEDAAEQQQLEGGQGAHRGDVGEGP